MSVRTWTIASAVAALLVVLGLSSLYVVSVPEYAIVVQFGRVVDVRDEPGLYFKLPFVQSVTSYDRRLREWDGEPSDLLTVDKENIEINTFARWRVIDPVKFYEALRTETAGQGVLDGLIDSSVKNQISGQPLMEVLRNTARRLRYTAKELEKAEASKGVEIKTGREKIVGAILAYASATTEAQYGIVIEGVHIKQFNYVRAVIPKIYERMRSERIRIANRYESEGREREARILGKLAKELERIESEGYEESTRVRGEADAEALRVYAEAYGQDPEFYTFRRTLELLPQTIGPGTRLVLSTESSDLFRRLQDYKVSGEAPGRPR